MFTPDLKTFKALAKKGNLIPVCWDLMADMETPVSAFAKVECALPPRFFVDYLTLLKTKDGWRIVAKAFKTETK